MEKSISFEKKVQGVRGWLLILCIILTIFTPLSLLNNLIQYSELMEKNSALFSVYSGIKYYLILTLIFDIFTTIFNVTSGLLLWRKLNGAVKLVKFSLLYNMSVLVIMILLVFVMFPKQAVGEAFKGSLQYAPYFFSYAFWFQYIVKSKRVENTYGSHSSEVSITWKTILSAYKSKSNKPSVMRIGQFLQMFVGTSLVNLPQSIPPATNGATIPKHLEKKAIDSFHMINATLITRLSMLLCGSNNLIRPEKFIDTIIIIFRIAYKNEFSMSEEDATFCAAKALGKVFPPPSEKEDFLDNIDLTNKDDYVKLVEFFSDEILSGEEFNPIHMAIIFNSVKQFTMKTIDAFFLLADNVKITP